MQATSLSGRYGLPLCISGITQHFIFSQEMADHEERREGMKRKKKRSEARNGQIQENHEMGGERNSEREIEEIREGERSVDLVHLIQDLSVAYVAKAA